MSTCLGLYIEDNIIKYAKVSKERDNIKVEAFGVKFYENLEKARGAITKRTKGDIYAIINFNYMNDFNKMLREDDDK